MSIQNYIKLRSYRLYYTASISKVLLELLHTRTYRMAKILLIVAAFLFLVSYLPVSRSTDPGACALKEYTYPAYYSTSTHTEKCHVKFHACYGDCFNEYVHLPHQTSHFTEAHLACKWTYRKCNVISHSTVYTYLIGPCTNLDGGASTFDPSAPWTVTIANATVCACSHTYSKSYSDGADEHCDHFDDQSNDR